MKPLQPDIRCPKCATPVTKDDYIGSNLEMTEIYYMCSKCGRLFHAEEKKA